MSNPQPAGNNKQRSSHIINWINQISLSDMAHWAIFALVVVGIILNTFASYHQRLNALKIKLHSEYEGTLAAASMLTSRIQDVWLLEEAVSNMLITLDELQVQTYLTKLLTNQSPTGRIIISLTWITTPVNAYVTTRPHTNFNSSQQFAQTEVIEQVEAGHTLALSNLAFNDDNLPSAMIARGVFQQEKRIGIIIAEVDIKQLASFLYTSTDSYRQFQLYDAKGQPAFLPSSHIRACANLPIPGTGNRQLMLRPKERGTYDRMCLLATAEAAPLGWSVQITTEEAAGASFDSVSYHMVNTIVATLVLLWVMIGIRRNQIRIRTLQKAAMAISQGNLDARASLSGDDDLAAAAATFDQMAARIQQLEVSRNRFLQVAAHELRNPMAGLKGVLSMWRRRLETGREVTNAPQLIDIMEHETDRLSILLNEILEAFRVQEGQLALDIRPVDLNQVLYLAARPFQVSTYDRHFYMSLPSNAVIVEGDLLRLEEVFRNLINNAIKYSSNDGDIHLSLQTHNGLAEVKVTDTGLGIPPDQLDRVFEGFFRGTNLAGKDPGGLGLGLYICKDIVGRHNGQIWVESCEGQGSTFHVSLPLYTA